MPLSLKENLLTCINYARNIHPYMHSMRTGHFQKWKLSWYYCKIIHLPSNLGLWYGSDWWFSLQCRSLRTVVSSWYINGSRWERSLIINLWLTRLLLDYMGWTKGKGMVKGCKNNSLPPAISVLVYASDFENFQIDSIVSLCIFLWPTFIRTVFSSFPFRPYIHIPTLRKTHSILCNLPFCEPCDNSYRLLVFQSFPWFSNT